MTRFTASLPLPFHTFIPPPSYISAAYCVAPLIRTATSTPAGRTNIYTFAFVKKKQSTIVYAWRLFIVVNRCGCVKEWLHYVRVLVPLPPLVPWRCVVRRSRSSVEALRRFSSGDLQSECDEGEVDPYTGRPATTSQPKPQPQHQRPVSQATGGSIGSASSVSSGTAGAAGPAGPAPPGSDLSLNLRGGSRGTSAPSSPAKSRESLLQRVQSLTGAARDQGANLLGSVTSVASVGRGYNRDRCVTLLVVDDQNTDWSKYFRGRRLPGEWDIRVEQAEFKELSVTANSDGANVSMSVYRSGTKVTRCFKPDFVLVRQNVRDAGADHRALLLGLKFGGVPSINSLNSIYHFQDRPWVFGHLLQLQRRLGRENFPLIEQTYYHNYTDMVSA
ncbi:Synapsin [Papilio xuthus]|uniref:Synapsin n=1 Tax=Papilio xuthus TaxID=66420 RepID=A0A194PYN3_PAPXU|nr:Synapsin [Papilio xuthus]